MDPKGCDYDKTYAPVTNLMSVKTLLSIANRLDLTIFSTDVKAAFLQSELEETIYVRFDGKVYRLYKTLYGLKQSAYMWNADLDKELRGNHDMTQSRGDPCFYFRKNDDGLLLVVTWVDDLICASTTNSIRDEKQTLCSLLDGSGQEVYLGHTGECKLVTTAAHQVLPTWIGTYS